jgi:hypothetical protein
VIQPNQVTAGDGSEISRHLVSEDLVLRKDGRFDQSCHLASGETYRSVSGTWGINLGYVHFSKLKDCSGFLGQLGGETGASLIVNTGKPIRILLNPDLSVYYERKTNTSAKID